MSHIAETIGKLDDNSARKNLGEIYQTKPHTQERYHCVDDAISVIFCYSVAFVNEKGRFRMLEWIKIH